MAASDRSLVVPSNSGFDKPPKSGYLALAYFGLTSLGLIAWHFHYSFILFSDLDGGALTNAAWQQYNGSVPYRDFFTAIPPLFLLPAGWAFRCLGPTWGSLSVLVCFFSFLTFAWLFLLLWRTTGAIWKALGVSFAVQILTLAPISWWGYNAITEVVAAVFFAAVCGLATRPRDRVAACSFVLAEALLGLGKANIAGPLLILSLAFLLTIPKLRFLVVAATLAALVLDLGILASQRITVFSLMQSYLEAAPGRLSPAMLNYILNCPGGGLPIIIMTPIVLMAMATFLAILLTSSADPRARAQLLVLFGIALFVAICGVVANYDSKTVDITCLVVLTAFVKAPPGSAKISSARLAYGVSHALIASLMLWNLMTGVTRWQFYWFGGWYAPPALRVTLQDPPLFRGMQVSPILVDVLHDVADVLKDGARSNDRAKKIFFGSRLDFCYPAFGVPVEAFLPLLWENVPSTPVDRTYPTGRPEASEAFRYPLLPAGHPRDPRVQRFLDAKFDLCLFRIGPGGQPDMSFMPADLRGELYEHYSLNYHGTVAIFAAK